VIESVSFSGGPSVTIKSHHNVGGLPEKMGLKLVEPLRELFKDEVRALGRELGLPASFIGRHPFPGPGLAIRCPGEITREKLDILRKADAVYIDQIRKHGLYDEIWQAFAAILPMRTVGVMGDGRTYDYALALRAVTSVDGMTADYYPFTHDFLGETATRIINEVKGVNRVFYDCTSKPPPGTIERRVRRRTRCADRLQCLRERIGPAPDRYPDRSRVVIVQCADDEVRTNRIASVAYARHAIARLPGRNQRLKVFRFGIARRVCRQGRVGRSIRFNDLLDEAGLGAVLLVHGGCGHQAGDFDLVAVEHQSYEALHVVGIGSDIGQSRKRLGIVPVYINCLAVRPHADAGLRHRIFVVALQCLDGFFCACVLATLFKYFLFEDFSSSMLGARNERDDRLRR
jgi:hypothetical protein